MLSTPTLFHTLPEAAKTIRTPLQTRAKLHNAPDYAYKPGSLSAPRYPHNLHYIKWHSSCRAAHPPEPSLSVRLAENYLLASYYRFGSVLSILLYAKFELINGLLCRTLLPTDQTQSSQELGF